MPTLLLFAVCVLVWGTTWFAITAQLAAIAPEVGVALRFGLAAAILLGWCAVRALPLGFGWRHHRWFALQGLAGFSISYVFIYHAERFIVSGVVAVGYAASPLVVMVMARLFNGTPMSRRVAAGGALGLAGVALIFSHEFARLGASENAALGAVLAASAVLLSGVATIAATRYQRDGVKGWAPLAWAMLYGALGSLVSAWLARRSFAIEWSVPFVASLGYLTLAGSIVAFGAFYGLVHRIGPARAGYVGVMTPIVALLVSWWLEGFVWTGETLAGVALALAGNVIALWQPRAGAGPVAVPPANQAKASSTTTGA
ncbi:DMT family transporter [Ideonella sp. DXS29W]|uniref:DMT family transporter n=1 Tax=Ideonella lacteola TaxID=2984193 RepID=A0ABU9BQ95_9BURK